MIDLPAMYDKSRYMGRVNGSSFCTCNLPNEFFEKINNYHYLFSYTV